MKVAHEKQNAEQTDSG